VASAAAGGGYLVAAQTTANAQSPAEKSSGSSSTPSTCTVHKDLGGDPAAAAKRRDVEQLASELGVSMDRLDEATIAVKQQGVALTDPRAAGIIAQALGLDPAVVQRGLDRMFAKFPFNEAYSTNPKVAGSAARVQAKSAETAGCRNESKPSDANDPKSVALRGLARDLGVTMPQLAAAFGTTDSHGVRTLDDPRMPAALGQALGLDRSRVQSAIAGMLSQPPFDRATAGRSATSARK
jgi:hypothetical protein